MLVSSGVGTKFYLCVCGGGGVDIARLNSLQIARRACKIFEHRSQIVQETDGE